MSAERPDEQELRDAQLSKLYRESGAPEPSAEIDQAILAAARREVHAEPRRLGHWMRQWRVPVSIAATIVVSATLVMLVVDEGGHRLEESSPVAPAPAPKESPAPQTAPTKDLRPPSAAMPERKAEARGDAPKPPSTHAESDSAAARQLLKSPPKSELAAEGRAPVESPRAQPAPPPATLARPFPATPPAPEPATRAEAEDRAAPQPESAAPRVAEAPPRDAPAGRIDEGLQADERARADDAGTGTARLGVRGFTDAPLAGGQQAAPSQDEIGSKAPSEPQKAKGPATRAQERADPAAATAPTPAAKRAPAPKPKAESRGALLARDLADQPPEKWLERVEQLRREDRRSDADHLMVEFRRRFPDHPAAHRAP